jgi:hypothetical protein
MLFGDELIGSGASAGWLIKILLENPTRYPGDFSGCRN